MVPKIAKKPNSQSCNIKKENSKKIVEIWSYI